ncbi:hypothetical protein FQR65_LT20252 [Abscondita terminalis]|nr:hypothetical protein FQR65_LT20252 [Abscondita terminalis]
MKRARTGQIPEKPFPNQIRITGIPYLAMECPICLFTNKEMIECKPADFWPGWIRQAQIPDAFFYQKKGVSHKWHITLFRNRQNLIRKSVGLILPTVIYGLASLLEAFLKEIAPFKAELMAHFPKAIRNCCLFTLGIILHWEAIDKERRTEYISC